MTKKSAIDRVLEVYRPLYLQGLLLDGQYRLPKAATQEEGRERPARRRYRFTLVALAGLHHLIRFDRSQP